MVWNIGGTQAPPTLKAHKGENQKNLCFELSRFGVPLRCLGFGYGCKYSRLRFRKYYGHLRPSLRGAVIRLPNPATRKPKRAIFKGFHLAPLGARSILFNELLRVGLFPLSVTKVRIILYKTIPLYKKVQKNLHLFRKCLKINDKKSDISLYGYKTKNKAF